MDRRYIRSKQMELYSINLIQAEKSRFNGRFGVVDIIGD